MTAAWRRFVPPETRLETWLRFVIRTRSLRVPWRWTKVISMRRVPDSVIAYFDELEARRATE